MKILVTGADGFIGSHLVEALVKMGHDVRAFTMYNSFNSNGWLDDLKDISSADLDIFSGDIRDPHGVKVAMAGCDTVLHLAALIAIPFSYHSPASYVDTNVIGTLNILQAARDCSVRKIIHTSTSEVYGTAQYVPIDERHPLKGQSPYSATKIAADQLALSFHHSFDLPVCIVRPFNTYGPRQSARAVIPTIITQLASNREHLKLGSISPTRDFNYVDDTVSGFMSAIDGDSGIGMEVNFGSNYEISIGDVAKKIAKLMGKQMIIEADEERFRPAGSEVERLWASNKLAEEIYGWSPSYAGIDGLSVGLERTIEWFGDVKNLRRYNASKYNI